MRKLLRTLLSFGHHPMQYYATDLSKYFYFGELMALVDLSLVRAPAAAAWACQQPPAGRGGDTALKGPGSWHT